MEKTASVRSAGDMADEVSAAVIARINAEFVLVTAVVLGGGQGAREYEMMVSPSQAEAYRVKAGDRLYICPAPPKATAENHLYLVEILGVGVKVGITGKPEKRFAQHVSAAVAFGRAVGRVWLSQPHPQARLYEMLVQGDHPNEYLPVSFEAAMERVRDLSLEGELQPLVSP